MAVGFMLFSLWKAKLISYLAQRSIVLPFDGVESLMLTSDYKIFAWPSSAQTDSFKLSKVPLWQQAWLERMEPNQEFYKEYIGGTYSPFFAVHHSVIKLFIADNYDKQQELLVEYPDHAVYDTMVFVA